MLCWVCCLPWKSSASSTNCGNRACRLTPEIAEEILRNAKKKEVDDEDNVPSLRACPRIECRRQNGIQIMEHESDCRHIVCPACGVTMCWVCLGVDSSADDDEVDTCDAKGCTIAPLQKAADLRED
jgi:hypothetical protein